jgi:uncharacterized membrane protein
MKTNTTATHRILSIDVLRGLIMIIMALDHVRDFFSNVHYDPLDLSQTSPQLFLTRFVTHYCAPTFVFLAGTSAFLYLSKGKTKKQASLFLLTRGLWLVFAELAIINLLWSFDIGYHFIGVQVIWAIGWSMIFLSAIIFLPLRVVGIIGLIIIFGHNLLDGIHAESFGKAKIFWAILHEQNFIQLTKDRFFGVMYPLIPWIGVMAAGYAFGSFFKMEWTQRKKWFSIIGVSCIVLFVVIRYATNYGDLRLWQHQTVCWKNVFAFINVTKYPPSLLYLLITLGPSILLLLLFEKMGNALTRFFAVYGRVPFFYYIMHLAVIHTAMYITTRIIHFDTSNFTVLNPDPYWGYSLKVVYLVWIAVVLSLYYPCRWFMRLKARRKDWWLSYL